nr:hypothetical protein [Tanacetum cinerariifolium]
RIGLGGGAGDNTGDNGDAGGEDIANSLTISESVHAGIGCGGSVAADSSVSNGSVSSANGAWSAAVRATTIESAGAGCSSSSSS